MEQNVRQSLHDLILRLSCDSNHNESIFKIQYDPDWPTLCYQHTGAPGEWVNWRPVEVDVPLSFANIEKALKITLNEQFCQYFTTNWSFHLPVQASEGPCELLQVCNQADFDLLQQNLIGHLLMKQQLNQPYTLFFAVTDEEDLVISVDNASGEVVLEPVGKEPIRCLAPDLATFLDSLNGANV